MKSNKKIIAAILLLMAMLNFLSCANDDANKSNDAADFIFYGYGENAVVPDFLTGEQQSIYKMATSLYHVALSPDVLDIDRFFPLKDGQEYIAPNDPWVAEFTADDGSQYAKSVGRYRKWADFERLVTAVFTQGAFNELNQHDRFIKIDGDLYILGATGMPRQGYMPGLDTFNLISSSDNEIKFTVTGYFGESAEEITNEITKEVILTKTANGWRFSKFAVVWE